MATQTENRSSGGDSRRRTPLPLNEIRRADGRERETPSRDIPDNLKPHYHQDNNAYRSAHRNDKIEFVDRGHRMHAYRPVSQFTVRALASIAALRGMSKVEITGDREFKSRAFVELASRGIEVNGYEATEKDQAILQRRADRKAAQDNPVVQAFVSADSKKAQTAAAKKFPELKAAFVTMAVVDKMAGQIPEGRGRDNWHGAMKDRLVLAVHRGEPMPDVKLREAPAAATAGTQER